MAEVIHLEREECPNAVPQTDKTQIGPDPICQAWTMGFVARLENSRDVTTGSSTSLPLAAPTRLRLPIDPDDGPSLPVFVFDPAPLRGGSGWETTLRIHQAADEVDSIPIDDISEISNPLRDQIEDTHTSVRSCEVSPL